MKYIHGHTFLAMMPQNWISYKSKGRQDFSQLNNKRKCPNWLQYAESVNFTGNSLYYTFAQASTLFITFCKNEVSFYIGHPLNHCGLLMGILHHFRRFYNSNSYMRKWSSVSAFQSAHARLITVYLHFCKIKYI